MVTRGQSLQPDDLLTQISASLAAQLPGCEGGLERALGDRSLNERIPDEIIVPEFPRQQLTCPYLPP
jgi:hypothetical protein